MSLSNSRSIAWIAHSPAIVASRGKTRRLAYASALAALALAGVVGLGLPQSAVHAQLKADSAGPDARPRAAFLCRHRRSRQAGGRQHLCDQRRRPAQDRAGPKGGPKGAPGSPRECSRACPTIIRSTSSSRTCRRSGATAARRAAADAGPGLRLRRLALTATSSPTTTSSTARSKIQVSFDKDNKFDAELIGTDPRTDLALLKIKAHGKTFPFVKFADEDARASATG